MESLLQPAFDNISHASPAKIGKGLRQIEGLLAQICLSASNTPATASFSSSSTSSSLSAAAPQSTKHRSLEELAEDLAFREFFRLQEGFEWNVASRLTECLERLLGMGNNGHNDSLIASALDLLQGILLLHPPSRTLFARERNMTLLLDLLTPPSPPPILISTLHVLVCALLGYPHNTRTFERCAGIATLTALFRSRTAGAAMQQLRLKVVEFFYFYLLPEERTPVVAGAVGAEEGRDGGGGEVDRMDLTPRSPSKSGSHAPISTSPVRSTSTASSSRTTATGPASKSSASEVLTRTTAEKQALLGRHLGDAAGLVQDLRESGALFGAVDVDVGVDVGA